MLEPKIVPPDSNKNRSSEWIIGTAAAAIVTLEILGHAFLLPPAERKAQLDDDVNVPVAKIEKDDPRSTLVKAIAPFTTLGAD